MAVDSKVEEFLGGLRAEEDRLKKELAAAAARVKELQSEVAKVQKGIQALHRGAGVARKRSSGKSSKSRAQAGAASCQGEVCPDVACQDSSFETVGSGQSF